MTLEFQSLVSMSTPICQTLATWLVVFITSNLDRNKDNSEIPST